MNINKSKLSLVTLIITILLPLPLNITANLLLSSQVLAQSSQNQEAQADKLLQEGLKKIANQQFENAIPILKRAISIYQVINKPGKEALALSSVGLAYDRLDKYIQAVEYNLKGLNIIRKISNQKLADLPNHRKQIIETNILFGLINSYQSLGDLSKANDYAQQALITAKKSGDLALEASSYVFLGNLANNDHNAISNYENSLNIVNKINSQEVLPLKARILLLIGSVTVRSGNIDIGKSYIEQSRNIAKTNGDRKLQLQIGQILTIIESIKNVSSNSNIQLLKPLLPLIQKVKTGLEISGNFSNPGNSQDSFQAASNSLKECDQYLNQFTATLQNINNLNDLRELADKLDNCFKNTEKYLQNPQELTKLSPELSQSQISQQLDKLNSIMNNLPNQSDLKKRGSENDIKIQKIVEGAIQPTIDRNREQEAFVRKSNSREEVGVSLDILGNSLFIGGKLAEVEEKLFAAIEKWESIRTDLGNNDSYKVSYFDTKIKTYQLLQIALIKQNKIEKALEVAERGRARAFIDLLAAQNLPTNQIASDIPDISLLKKIAQQQQATIVEYSLINHPNVSANNLYIWVIKPTGEVKFKDIDLKEWEEKNSLNLNDLVTAARSSVIKDNRGGEQPSNIFKIGDRVKLKDEDWPDEPSSVIIGKNSQTGKWILQIPGKPDTGKPDTYERAESDLEKVTTVHDIKTGLHQLHQLLIEPIADFLPKNPNDRVIFVPQQLLFSVPFPALQDQDGRYLIEKHTILTAPAIQVLDSTHQRRKQVPGNAKEPLIIGNPTMLRVPLKPGAAPQQLRDLPNSKTEAENIARDFGTTALTGNQADKNTVIARMQKANIIHLATHGQLDDQQGINSGIVLTNSFLTAKEIINLKLNAELVVLSACDTGQGKLTGDGVIGLSRAFIAAGTPSVIVSLWTVGDQSTSYLMQQFYQNRKHSKDNAQALRQAMLTTMKKYPEPSQWAAFTLIGEAK